MPSDIVAEKPAIVLSSGDAYVNVVVSPPWSALPSIPTGPRRECWVGVHDDEADPV